MIQSAACVSAPRMIAGLLGPLLLGLGQGISVSAGFGSFGFSVLLDGLHTSFNLPLWLSQVLMTLCLFLLAWQWARIPLGPGSLPALLLIGPAISVGAGVTPEGFLLFGNLAAFFFGLFTFALGISLAAAAALGPDGVTALSLAAEKGIGWSVPKSTFLWNSLAILVGAGLGGNMGVSSLVALVCVPLLIHWMLPPLRFFVQAPGKASESHKRSETGKPCTRPLTSVRYRINPVTTGIFGSVVSINSQSGRNNIQRYIREQSLEKRH